MTKISRVGSVYVLGFHSYARIVTAPSAKVRTVIFLLFLYFLTDLLDSFFKLICIHASLLEFCRNLQINHWKISNFTKKQNGNEYHGNRPVRVLRLCPGAGQSLPTRFLCDS